ncbi:MAG: methyltransferase [Sphingomonadaceae bacterium]
MKAKFVLAAAACATLLAGAPALADQHEHGKMDHSLHGPLHHGLMMAAQHESRAEDKARDQYRHPVETLAFFQVAPDMKVGELAPGGGWYTRMLASYLSEKGELVGLYRHPSFATSDPERQAQMRADAAAFPEKVSKAGAVCRQTGSKGFTTDALPEERERNLALDPTHHRSARAAHFPTPFVPHQQRAGRDQKAMRSLLKDDGMIGIVQHRAKMDAPYAYADGTKGYVREADVIAMMEANGFEFMGRSEINANPADSADHPRGVWELPPVWGGKSEER